MKAEELLKEIFETKTVLDAEGNKYSLDSNIDEPEGEFLTTIIGKYQPQKTIEVGCAHGISSLYICSALEKMQDPHHTIVDAFQSSVFNNVGVSNLKKAGIGFFELIEDLSETALPKLLSAGNKYDLCFIDGNHTFDHTLVDFFYMNRMIDIGGIIIIDDTGMPAVNKLMRYILNYPAYKQIGGVRYNVSLQRKMFELIAIGPFRLFSKLFPGRLKYAFFAGSVMRSNKKLNLNSSMVALQKIKNDERSWNWFKDF
jgi:predicted O-methyltransferase YrrM